MADESVDKWKARIDSRILQLVCPKSQARAVNTDANFGNETTRKMKYLKLGAGKLAKMGLLKAPRYVAPDHSNALHSLWVQYINDALCGSKSDADILKRLFFADLHGAKLSVYQSSCPNYVNLKGIVVHDSNMTFRLAGEDGKVRTILKSPCVFELEISGQKYHLHGRSLQGPPLARSKLKPKPKSTVEL